MKRYACFVLVMTACASGGGGDGGGGGDDDGADDTDAGDPSGDGDGGGSGGGDPWLVIPTDFDPRISTEPGGDLYVGVTFRDTITLGGVTLTSAGGRDIAIARLAPDGHARWAKRFGATTDEILADLDAGADGVAVSGTFTGPIDFGGGTLQCANANGFCGGDAFVLRLDGNGAHRWSVDTDGRANAFSVALEDTGDHVLLVGQGVGPLASGTGYVCVEYYTCGLVALFQSNGQLAWTRGLRTVTAATTAQYRRGVFAPGGSVVVLGEATAAVITAGPYTYHALQPWNGGTGTTRDAILSSFSVATGAHQWSRRYGGDGDEQSSGLAVDGDQLLVTMSSSARALVVTQSEPLGDSDLVVARIQTTGDGTWSRRYGGFDYTQPSEVYADIQGRRLVSGLLTARATFGTSTLETHGPSDAYVVDVGDLPGEEPAVVLAPDGPGDERITDLELLGDRLVVAGHVTEPTTIMNVAVPARSAFVIAAEP